jgi:hypothetical protein
MFAMNTLRSAVLAASVCTGALIGAAGGGFFEGDQFPRVFADHSNQTTQMAAGTCAVEEPEIGAEEFSRTELYFGTARPDGTAVTATEWSEFLAKEITPRFPAGLTVISGMGQWQEEDSDIVQERSQLVILFYPREFAVESGAAIEEIRTAYETAFQQQSVLRADDDAAPVCVSF